MQKNKVILADDYPIYLEGLRSVIQRIAGSQYDVVATTDNGHTLLHLVKSHQPALVITELSLAERDGLEVLPVIKSLPFRVRVLILSRYSDPRLVREAFKAGAEGYLLKDRGAQDIVEALTYIRQGQNYIGRGVHTSDHGRTPARRRASGSLALSDRFSKKFSLTKREVEILQLISQALSNKEIAQELYISDQTVSVHRKNIMRKLGVSNTAGLLKAAFEHALV